MAIYQKNGSFWIDYPLPDGKRVRKKIGTNKKLAEIILKKRKVEIAENRHLNVRKDNKIKFEDFAKTFLDVYSRPNKRSWMTDYYNLKMLKTFFGGRYLYQIKPKDIEEFKAKRSGEVSPATCNRELAILKTLLTKAVEWDKLEVSPAKGIKFFRENNARLVYLEKEEIKRFLEACSDRFRPIAIVAIYTGMRRGEILNLKWQDIDLRQNVIHLLQTKNGQKREVYLNSTLRKALIGTPKHPDSPYVFYKRNGQPLKDIRKPFFTALNKAGIMKKLTFHSLRHTFGSQLAMSGIGLRTIQELMGHKDIRMTLRYSHLSADHKRRAVEVFDSKMDTFWTPETKMPKVDELVGSKPIENK